MKQPVLKAVFAIIVFILSLFLIPQTVLASCSSHVSCSSCVSDSSCIWASFADVCMSKADAQGFNPSGLTSSCGGSSSTSQQSAPTSTQAPAVKVLPTSKPKSTPAPVSKKADGQSCKINSDCKSGNCKNSRCCIKNKTCCLDSNDCSKEQYCSTSKNRYYCIPKLDNGTSCTSSDQCKSDNCGKGICCGGQPCCKEDSQCGKDEYCETKDDLYYCRVKWNVDEYCEKPSACFSGYCDPYVQKCAESSEKSTSTEKAVCGDKSCDDWLGENCTSCPKDCDNIADFCCSKGSQYANTLDWQNRIFNLLNPPGGSVPNGRLVVPKGTEETTYFSSYKPKICSSGRIIEGECIRSDQCAKGVCVDHKCSAATSDNPKQISDEKLAQEIFNDQMEYMQEEIWINVYDKLEDNLIKSTKVPGGLDIKLEVQGSTAGKVPEAVVGKDVETRLFITNDTNFSMAVVAGITYPGQLANTFKLEEKKYTLSCSPVNGTNPLTTVIGTLNAKRLGGNSYVLPPHHQLTIYSKVSPKQEGYMDVSGIIYFSKEKMYANSSVVEMAITPADFESSFQKSEVSDSILVNEKKCSWGIICI
ncbi:hypothetical protein KKE78_03600 [Patescibacteria group bacterium]|nr:hypothetical protein [Patescibacteria group bacterium]